MRSAAVFCVVCGSLIERNPGEPRAEYHRKKVCSLECKKARASQANQSQKKAAAPRLDNGFVIANGETLKGHPLKYIDVVYPTEARAAAEMADLLKYYPAGHVWRHKLSVKPWDAKAAKAPAMADAETLLAEVVGEEAA